MLPEIRGIALYPLYYKVPGGRTVLSGINFTTVPCAPSCAVPFADAVPHSLVCAGSAGGNLDRVLIEGTIVRKSGDVVHEERLEPRPLDREMMSRDGTCRVFWTWPNTPSCREVNATYEIRLRLTRRGDAPGSGPEDIREQGPFVVTLLPAPCPAGEPPGPP